MNAHYRVLDTTTLAGLRAGLQNDDEAPPPTTYDTLASFNAVQVGASSDVLLPVDTPYIDLLTAEDITTVSEARSMDLTVINGIGESRAAEILDALPADEIFVHVAQADSEDFPGTSIAFDGNTMAAHKFAGA